MSTTSMLTTDANARKLWSQLGFLDVYKNTMFGVLMEQNNLFQADELTGSSVGDRIRYNFTGRLTGIGVGEGEILEGNEEALSFDSHDLIINTFRHGVNSPNSHTIEQQRTYIPFEERAKKLLVGFMGTRLDASVFQQLAGAFPTSITIEGATYSGTNRTFVTGLNAITAPTTNRITRAAAAATDQALTSSDTMTVDLIDEVIVSITGATPTFEPLDGDRFVMVMAPQQFLDLKRDSSGAIQFLRDVIRPAAESGSDGILLDKNVLMMKEPQARYQNVDIYVSPNVAVGVNSSTSAAISTVRRAIFLGKNAGVFGSPYGRISDGKSPLEFRIQLNDYENKKGVSAEIIYGINKIVLDGEDYGVHVIPTFSSQ